MEVLPIGAGTELEPHQTFTGLAGPNPATSAILDLEQKVAIVRGMDLSFLLYNDARDDAMTGGADIVLVLDDLRFRAEGRLYTDRQYTGTTADVLAFSATWEPFQAGLMIAGDLNGKQVQKTIHIAIHDTIYDLTEASGVVYRPFVGIDFVHGPDKPYGWLDLRARFWGDGGDARVAAMVHGEDKIAAAGIFVRYYYGDQLSDCVNSVTYHYSPAGVCMEATIRHFLIGLSLAPSDGVLSLGWKF